MGPHIDGDDGMWYVLICEHFDKSLCRISRFVNIQTHVTLRQDLSPLAYYLNTERLRYDDAGNTDLNNTRCCCSIDVPSPRHDCCADSHQHCRVTRAYSLATSTARDLASTAGVEVLANRRRKVKLHTTALPHSSTSSHELGWSALVQNDADLRKQRKHQTSPCVPDHHRRRQ